MVHIQLPFGLYLLLHAHKGQSLLYSSLNVKNDSCQQTHYLSYNYGHTLCYKANLFAIANNYCMLYITFLDYPCE